VLHVSASLSLRDGLFEVFGRELLCVQADLMRWARTPPDDLASAPQLREHRQQIVANLGLFQAAVARRLYGDTAQPQQPQQPGDAKRRRLDRQPGSVLEPQPAGSLRRARLTSGCDVIDRVLRGGFPCGELSEVAGEASCGKTQICLQLLLAAQLPRRLGGLEGSAIYISTEGQLPRQRLQQIAMERPSFREHFQFADPLAHLFVKQVHTADELGFLLRQLPQLVEKQLRATPQTAAGGQSARPIRLVVIDSLAAPYRSESGIGGESNRRTLELLAHGARLKKLANAGGCENSLAVVVTNQVTAVMTTDAQDLLQAQPVPLLHGDGGSVPYAMRGARPGIGGWPSAAHSWPYGSLGKGAGAGAVPSLGLSWGSTANTRLLLTKARRPAGFTAAPGAAAPTPLGGIAPSILSEFSVGGAGGGVSSKRYIHVLNSPTAPMHGCEYALTSGGVTGIGQ
jgi:RecA/RadA recombinase